MVFHNKLSFRSLLQSLEGLYGVRDGNVRGCKGLSAHKRADRAEKKLEILHWVVALDLLKRLGYNIVKIGLTIPEITCSVQVMHRLTPMWVIQDSNICKYFIKFWVRTVCRCCVPHSRIYLLVEVGVEGHPLNVLRLAELDECFPCRVVGVEHLDIYKFTFTSKYERSAQGDVRNISKIVTACVSINVATSSAFVGLTRRKKMIALYRTRGVGIVDHSCMIVSILVSVFLAG